MPNEPPSEPESATEPVLAEGVAPAPDILAETPAPPAPGPSARAGARPFQLRRYTPRALVFYGVWCVIGYVLMFFGNPITDTVGLVVVFAEALLIYGVDRDGLKTMNGLVNWNQLHPAQRWLLGIGEVIVFPLTLLVYLIRCLLISRRYPLQARR